MKPICPHCGQSFESHKRLAHHLVRFHKETYWKERPFASYHNYKRCIQCLCGEEFYGIDLSDIIDHFAEHVEDTGFIKCATIGALKQ